MKVFNVNYKSLPEKRDLSAALINAEKQHLKRLMKYKFVYGAHRMIANAKFNIDFYSRRIPSY